ncbi:MAG: GFA family protein [Gammaproteobacteria bacterium]
MGGTGEKSGGGCLCGAVRYAFSGEIMFAGVCHCAVCRKMSGGVGGAWFGVSRDSCEISGKTNVYEYAADSGNTIRRAVCAECFAPVYNRNSMMPDMLVFAAGSLDDPALFAPQMRIYTAAAPSWCAPEDDLPRFAGMPVSADEANDAEKIRAAVHKTARGEG